MSNHRIGTYAVELSVMCSRTPCSVEDEATVRATSCEVARQLVMRMLRYRGWQVGKHAQTLCPKHAPALVNCARCAEATPPFYLEPRGSIYSVSDLPEFAAIPPAGLLCEGCRRHGRDVAFARLAEERAR